MHELSIAHSILDIVREAVPATGDLARLRVVKVRVGRLSGVLSDSLDFCFSALVGDTPLAGARLAIEEVPARIDCRGCGGESLIDDPIFACPACGSTDVRLIAGQELAVTELELAEDEEVP